MIQTKKLSVSPDPVTASVRAKQLPKWHEVSCRKRGENAWCGTLAIVFSAYCLPTRVKVEPKCSANGTPGRAGVYSIYWHFLAPTKAACLGCYHFPSKEGNTQHNGTIPEYDETTYPTLTLHQRNAVVGHEQPHFLRDDLLAPHVLGVAMICHLRPHFSPPIRTIGISGSFGGRIPSCEKHTVEVPGGDCQQTVTHSGLRDLTRQGVQDPQPSLTELLRCCLHTPSPLKAI